MERLARFAVDIGNSGARLVQLPEDPQSALPDPIRINWRKHRDDSQRNLSLFSLDQIAWPQFLLPLMEESDQSQWWISSVQRAAGDSLIETLRNHPNCQVQLVDYTAIPMELDVEYPDRVGIDRLLAALAASHRIEARPMVVIQAGSAVTIDLVGVPSPSKINQEWFGKFAGGAILPGVPMMLRLLSSAADMLPDVAASELTELPPLPGRNSQAAMLAGVSSSLVGGTQHVVRRYRDAHGDHTPIVLSGGDGPLLRPHLDEPIIEVDHLVLQGLRILSELQRTGLQEMLPRSAT